MVAALVAALTVTPAAASEQRVGASGAASPRSGAGEGGLHPASGMRASSSITDCGEAGERPIKYLGKALWVDSPTNGYIQLTVKRQVQDVYGNWKTLNTRKKNTKDGELEGYRGW